MTTRWALVRACADKNEAQAGEAIAELCQAYWLPVYACIRHQGHPTHDAQDLTQDFLAQLLRGRYFQHLDPSKGRFRAYLSTALKNFLRDRWRRHWTWQRGRGVTIVPLETLEAETGYAAFLATKVTPETLYERQWARTLVEHVLKQLEIELIAERKGILFEHFEAIMAGDAAGFPYAQVAADLNMTVGALHTALHRWRRRFRTLMCEEVARTVRSKSEVEEELRYLLNVSAGDL